MMTENVKWKMVVTLTIENEEDGSITEGVLYTDDEFGYYKRNTTICSSEYFSTFRFSKKEMGNVLKFIADNSPLDLEEYLHEIDQWSWIESDHNL